MLKNPKQPTSETVYRKVGRRYVPIGELSEHNSYSYGSYLMVVTPGVTSIIRVDVEKYIPEVEVAVKLCAEAMCKCMSEARSTPQLPQTTPLTDKQVKAFNMWKKAFCTDRVMLPSVYDVVNECTKELRKYLESCKEEQKGITNG
jgi:hypothetical protein